MPAWLRRVVEAYLFLCARLVLWRRKPTILGITGSVGKTTTKEMLASLFQTSEAVARYGHPAKTPATENDNLGVPISVLLLDGLPRTWRGLFKLPFAPFRALRLAFLERYPEILILEYGAGAKGTIRRTARLAPPDVGIVTAIGPSHLEVFGSVEGVARAKVPLVQNVPASGLVILGEDNPLIDWMTAQASAPVERVRGRGQELAAEIVGVVADRFGLSDAAVQEAGERHAPVHGRLRRIDANGITILDDAYNANPLSMRFGLDTLAKVSGRERRKIAILGGMKELGAESDRYHVEIGELARRKADLVVGVGDLAVKYDPQRWFSDSAQAAGEIWTLVTPGDVVIVKGSNSVGMARIVRSLEDGSEDSDRT